MSNVEASVVQAMLAKFVATDTLTMRLCSSWLDGGSMADVTAAEIAGTGYAARPVPASILAETSSANPVRWENDTEVVFGPNASETEDWPLIVSVALTYEPPSAAEIVALWVPTNEIRVPAGWSLVVASGGLVIEGSSAA